MIVKSINGTLLFAMVLIVGLMGCTKQKEESGKKQPEAKPARKAVAVMEATEGNTAHGKVAFTEVEGGIKVTAHFEGVPEGEHGFHIHEKGDCSSGDGKSAGGHFNPEGHEHAGPDAAMRHVGDLGNITANAEGMAEKEFVDSVISFDGIKSILDKGVILHADPDDLTSQPTGAAGARIACGVIKLVTETSMK